MMDQAEQDAIERTRDMRYKRFYENAKENIPALTPELCFFTPREVLEALRSNPVVTAWRKWLLEDYEPPEKEIAILFPDADRKPWTRGETSDRSFKNLHIAIKSLKLEERAHILSVSTLLGIVPEERFPDMPIYESGGMFSWSVKKRGLEWDAMLFRDALGKLGEIVADYMEKHQRRYQKVVAIYRTPSVHERIIGNAYDLKPFKLQKMATKKPLSKSYSDLKDMLKKAI